MHVVVVGCGRVGSELAEELASDGHSVAVVDKRASAFKRLPEGFSGSTVVGFGFDRDTLRAADIDRAGALAAVTSGDNSNIVIARVARETFAIERVVARIYDPRRAQIYQRLGIPTVATVSWTTDQVLRRLLPEQSRTDWVDPTGELCLVERVPPDRWAGEKLEALEEPGRFRLVSLTRQGQAQLPTPDAVAQDGDVLRFAVVSEALGELDLRLSQSGEQH